VRSSFSVSLVLHLCWNFEASLVKHRANNARHRRRWIYVVGALHCHTRVILTPITNPRPSNTLCKFHTNSNTNTTLTLRLDLTHCKRFEDNVIAMWHVYSLLVTTEVVPGFSMSYEWVWLPLSHLVALIYFLDTFKVNFVRFLPDFLFGLSLLLIGAMMH
jgi:hypothetical protein